jgi:hypothetical protein
LIHPDVRYIVSENNLFTGSDTNHPVLVSDDLEQVLLLS